MIHLLISLGQIGLFAVVFLFLVRNLDESLAMRWMKSSLMPKIVTFFVLFGLLSVFFGPYFLFSLLFFTGFVISVPAFYRRLHKKRLENAVDHVVHNVILGISAGHSLQRAYFLSIDQLKLELRPAFRGLWEIKASYSLAVHSQKLQDFSWILEKCRNRSVGTVDLLKSYRRTLVLKKKFEDRVTEGLAPLRAQMCLLAILFVGLLFALVYLNLLVDHLVWIAISICLYVLGASLVYLFPRRFKWLS